MRKINPLNSPGLDRDVDIIISFLFDENAAPLDDRLKLRWEQIQKCDSLTKTYVSRHKVAKLLVKFYPDITYRHALTIFDQCQEIMGHHSGKHQEFWVDLVMSNMADNRRKADAKGDYKTVSMIDRDMMNAVKDLFANGNHIPLEEFQLPDVHFGFFPELLGIKVPDNYMELIQKEIEVKHRASFGDTIPYQDIQPNEQPGE